MMGAEVGEAVSVLVEEEEAIAVEVFDKMRKRGKKKCFDVCHSSALIPCKIR